MGITPESDGAFSQAATGYFSLALSLFNLLYMKCWNSSMIAPIQ